MNEVDIVNCYVVLDFVVFFICNYKLDFEVCSFKGKVFFLKYFSIMVYVYCCDVNGIWYESFCCILEFICRIVLGVEGYVLQYVCFYRVYWYCLVCL